MYSGLTVVDLPVRRSVAGITGSRHSVHCRSGSWSAQLIDTSVASLPLITTFSKTGKLSSVDPDAFDTPGFNETKSTRRTVQSLQSDFVSHGACRAGIFRKVGNLRRRLLARGPDSIHRGLQLRGAVTLDRSEFWETIKITGTIIGCSAPATGAVAIHAITIQTDQLRMRLIIMAASSSIRAERPRFGAKFSHTEYCDVSSSCFVLGSPQRVIPDLNSPMVRV